MSRRRALTAVLHVVFVLALLTSCADDPTVVDTRKNPVVIDSEDAVVEALERAYSDQDPELLASILVNDDESDTRYVFLLSEPTDLGETNWGWEEEVRIHERMFRPQNVRAGDSPVPDGYWLEEITITLTALGEFEPREDLYTRSGGALGEDRWIASDARYATNVFFRMAGDTDFQVEGEANFVVLEDRTKEVGDTGKFLLYIWEDLMALPVQMASGADGT